MHHTALDSGSRKRRAAATVARLLGIALAIAFVASTSGVNAATYKWTDANGHVVYSDQPPPGDIKSERIGPAPPPANPNAVKEMAQKEVELKKRQDERAGAEGNAEKARQVDTRRRDLCLVVRGKLKDMRAGMKVFKYDDKGARIVLNDAERAGEMAKQVEAEKKYCGESST